MHFRSVLPAVLLSVSAGTLAAQRPDSLSEEVRRYVALDTNTVVLSNVLLIDGTGGAPRPGHTKNRHAVNISEEQTTANQAPPSL